MPVPLIPLTIAIATGGGAMGLGYLLNSTYEGKVLKRLQEKYESAYPSWPMDALNINDNIAVQAIGKLRWYVKNKKLDLYNEKALRNISIQILKDLKLQVNPMDVRKMNAFLLNVRDTITKDDGDLYSYIRGGLTDRDLIVKKVSDIASQATVITEKTVPWFLKPRNILKVAIGGAVAYVGIVYVLPMIKKGKK